MTTQSSVHDWAKGKLNEMDARVATLQGKVGQLQGDARTKAESALADMRARRDAFQETIKKEEKSRKEEKEEESAKAAMTHAKAELETHVKAFEASAQKVLSHTGGGTR